MYSSNAPVWIQTVCIVVLLNKLARSGPFIGDIALNEPEQFHLLRCGDQDFGVIVHVPVMPPLASALMRCSVHAPVLTT